MKVRIQIYHDEPSHCFQVRAYHHTAGGYEVSAEFTYPDIFGMEAALRNANIFASGLNRGMQIAVRGISDLYSQASRIEEAVGNMMESREKVESMASAKIERG